MMKKGIRSVAGIVLAVAMLFTLTACGSGGYTKSVENIMTQIQDSNNASLSVDYTDADAVATYCTDTKAIYQSLLDLKAPSKYADAQAKYASGAQSMIDYLDALPAYCAMSDSDDKEATRQELQATYVSALTDIATGNSMTGVAQSAADAGGTTDEGSAS